MFLQELTATGTLPVGLEHFESFHSPFVHEAISHTASLHPNRVAIQHDRTIITFHQLESLSNKLANFLIDNGAKPEVKIGVCFEPGPELVISILAILKSGAAYIPLMPSLPVHRIQTILNDAAAAIILTSEQLAADMDIRGTQVHVFNCEKWNTRGDATKPSVELQPGHAAYVLYTSGSTGVPKGVVIEHRNLSYYLNWTISYLLPKAGVRLPLTSSMSFAAGVTQMYAPLLSGDTMFILPADIIRQPDAITDWYKNHPEYGLYCVPTLWNEILEWSRNTGSTVHPKAILLSGEALPGSLLERTFHQFPGIRVWNLYGPTEAVANLSATEIIPGEEVTIGEPLAGTSYYIVNENGTEVLPGETGELLASGPGIARGYLGRQDLTDAAFIAFNTAESGPVRAYRTGDLVKQNHKGKLIYQGRIDQQVKIRGYRIELMEVELNLKKVPGVKQAVVKKHETADSTTCLVAYVENDENNTVTVPYMRRELGTLLPDYMIPERWVFVDAFPTLANGKINRKQLPEPGNPRPALGYEPTAATSGEEQKLVTIFESVLGYNGIGVLDNFFDLGGTSLKINAVINEVRTVFSSVIPYRSLFDHPTPRQLLSVIREHVQYREHGSAGNAPRHLPAPNQMGLWFIEQTNTQPNAAYNIPYAIIFEGKLNTGLLHQSIQAVVQKHQTLRTCFRLAGGMPSAEIRDFIYPELQIVDLSYMQDQEAKTQAYQTLEHLAAQPFDLAAAPLFRMQLYRLDGQKHILGLVFHHIIFDGWSANVFHDDLLNFYEAYNKGITPDIKEPQVTYQHFSSRYFQYDQSKESAAARSFWKPQLAGAPGNTLLPPDYGHKKNAVNKGGRVSCTLDSSFREKLIDFNKKEHTTSYLSLLAAFALLLQRYTNEDDLLIGTPVANRDESAYYGLIGYFTNTLMLRLKLQKDRTFRELLRDVKETCLASFDFSSTPFDRQMRILREQSAAGQTANVHVMFAFHEATSRSESAHLVTSITEHFNHAAKVPLFFECQDSNEGIKLSLTYDKNLYHEQTILQFLHYYTALLSEVIEDPALPAVAYDIQTPFEKERTLLLSEGARRKYRGDHQLHHLVEAAADKYGSNTAIICDGVAVTYTQLESLSNKLAASFKKEGLEEGQAAGIFMEHSPVMIAAMLAVIKCGAYYVPLDPSYPEKRNSYVIEHSGLKLILADELLVSQLPEHSASVYVVAPIHAYQLDEQMERISANVSPSSLLYTIYTSGSTGKPKGVMVPHQGVCNYLLWMEECFGLTEQDRILARTSISFDISVWELFLPLISGGAVVLTDRNNLKAPEQIAALIQKEHITVAQFVPSGLKTFADAGVMSSCKSLQKIFSGGEQLPLSLQQSVHSQFKGTLHNLYGPTEASIFMCHWQCSPLDDYRSVTIGRPIPNSSVYILDRDLKPVPPGFTGEIYIGGSVLAKGYMANEEQTRKAFVPSPFHQGEIIYKTGDLGRWFYDGNIEFLGRADHQVKVRGYRIELGEIEECLMNIAGIRRAVVYRRELSEDDVRLVTYLIADNGNDAPDESGIRATLKSQLPEYMVPSAFHFVPSIPVLPNGKTDFKSLIDIQPIQFMQKEEIIQAFTQKDDVEKVVREIWEEVLGRNDFKSTDNFMDAGGHSILLVRVCELINERLDENYTLIDMFQYTSIQAFVRHYREKHGGAVQQGIIDRVAKRKMNINNMKRKFNRS